MREHAHLPAVVRLVRKHVAQHFHANRPRPSPAVSVKHLDASASSERFSKHLLAPCCALGQSRPSLPRRAVRPIKLLRNLQVRSRKPHPFAAHIVHMRKNRPNGADLPGRFGAPRCSIKTFDKHLIHALIGGKYPCRRSSQLARNRLCVN